LIRIAADFSIAAFSPGERARQFGGGFQSGSMSTRSVLWG
jgi:hypothetical protein